LHEAEVGADAIGIAKMSGLKEASPHFVVMRRLARRFRGILHGSGAKKS
jgi:hypothetical protein